MTLVRNSIGISHLNNTLTLGDCVCERWTLEVVLTYWSYNWSYWSHNLNAQFSAAKYPCGVFLRKKGSLSKLGHRGFLALLVVDYASCMLVTVREDGFGED